MTSRPIRSVLPPSETGELAETRNRSSGKNWKYVPLSPAGRSPAWRARSATHTDAAISSSVPPSRPRIASPASVNRSALRSASVMRSMASCVRAPPEATRATQKVSVSSRLVLRMREC